VSFAFHIIHPESGRLNHGGDFMNKQENEAYEKRRKILAAVSILMFIVILTLLSCLFIKVFAPYMRTSDEFRSFLDTFGWKGRLILFALQCVQVVIALIPGEVIELGAGYAYGALEGTLICMAGIALSSSFIFLLTKKFGAPLVELFISREKIHELRFINSEKKLKRLIFLLFFIPGTPKDVLTYFVGLTNIRLLDFLIISLVARIPSLLSSTLCGGFLGTNRYVMAIILYAITAIVSIAGYVVYNKIVSRKKND
jgi:uncharacterized membrane protein YdjX (TVP38/TMEM64 family)